MLGDIHQVHPSAIRQAFGSPPRHRIPWLVIATWFALFVNVVPIVGGPTLIPIPEPLTQAVTQGALVLALLLALMANPRVVIRPQWYLLLLTVAGVVSLLVSVHNEFLLGSTYRAGRLLVFLVVLWLLTPWWGRRDMLLLRCHRWFMWVLLGSVLIGAIVWPGEAFKFDGRLAGVIWPIWPTHVAHYAAVLLGTSAVLWLSRVITGRNALFTIAVCGAAIYMTHTRTAIAAVVLGLVFAGASLFLGQARSRRVTAVAVATAFLVSLAFASPLTTWLMRGQSEQEALALTGRTDVWSEVFEAPRPALNDLFGSGVSDKSFNGLPIDSSWVSTYYDQGWFGVAIQGVVLLSLLLMAAARPRGPRRAVALFLIVYCTVASLTETGLLTPSPYLLDLTVAAALLTNHARRGQT